MSVIDEIAAERHRQIDLGYDISHDDEHDNGEIIMADWGAVSRICGQALLARKTFDMAGYRKLLIEGAALIVAEIERLDRAAAKAGD